LLLVTISGHIPFRFCCLYSCENDRGVQDSRWYPILIVFWTLTAFSVLKAIVIAGGDFFNARYLGYKNIHDGPKTKLNVGILAFEVVLLAVLIGTLSAFSTPAYDDNVRLIRVPDTDQQYSSEGKGLRPF
jgi:hypothetical protein